MRPARSTGSDVRLVATDAGVDLICDAADTDALAAALRGRGAVGRRRGRGGGAARGGRPPALRRRPRRHGHPPGGGPQRARGVASPRAATSGQETVARLHYKGKPNRHLRGLRLSAPAAARRRAAARRARWSGRRHGRRLAAPRAGRPSRSCAARPSPAPRWPSATATRRPRSSSCRSSASRGPNSGHRGWGPSPVHARAGSMHNATHPRPEGTCVALCIYAMHSATHPREPSTCVALCRSHGGPTQPLDARRSRGGERPNRDLRSHATCEPLAPAPRSQIGASLQDFLADSG